MSGLNPFQQRAGTTWRARGLPSFLQAILAAALMLVLIGPLAPQALAGPVNWEEVPATGEGRQWWDSGSLRRTKSGHLSVLSRFQPAPEASDSADGKAKLLADLYVMEIDCDQQLFRDTSINGLPQFKAPWLPSSGDNLISSVIEASCQAASQRPELT